MDRRTRSSNRRTAEPQNTSKAKQPVPKSKRRLLWRVARWVVVIGFVGGLLGVAGVGGIFWYYSADLPEIFDRSAFIPRQVTRVYDRDGQLLAEFFDERRTVIPIEAIPKQMTRAMISAEDANFYEHHGMDTIGILRAAYNNVRRGGFSQGASTITQQVVKNLLLSPERTLKRKVQEVLLARRIEDQFSKDDILWMYLNYVYFGHGNYGISEAAHYFFDKPVQDLSLSECATLAGIVQSPERLSPIKHPQKARERRDYVLRQMRKHNHIDEATLEATLAEDITVRRPKNPTLGAAPHFVEYVRQQLIAEYGRDYVYTAGLQVHTTLNLTLQLEGERALQKGLRDYDARQGYFHQPLSKKQKVADNQHEATITKIDAPNHILASAPSLDAQPLPLLLDPRAVINPSEMPFKEGDRLRVVLASAEDIQRILPSVAKDKLPPRALTLAPSAEGALVSIDPNTREVVALVGGFSFGSSSFNRATQAMRQTGSSFKPLVFAAALHHQVITPATVIADAPKVYHIPGRREPWSPKNFDNKYLPPMTARKALALSRNTIAVDILERLGLPRAIAFARLVGIHSALPENLTLALGSGEVTALEMTNTFATFASGGFYAEPIFIRHIITPSDPTTPWIPPRQPPQQVIPPESAFLITTMMRAVVTEGTAQKALKGWPTFAVGKTGTTNGPRDAWFIGYTSSLVTSVYVGFDQPADLGSKEGGSATALPIWADFMKAANLPSAPPTPPATLEAIPIDPQTGLRASPDTKSAHIEYFWPGTAPPLSDSALDPQQWMMNQVGGSIPGANTQPPATTTPSLDDFDGF